LAICYGIVLTMLDLVKYRKSSAALSLVFDVMSVVLSRGGVAWVYISHARTQTSFVLSAPGPCAKKPGGSLKGLFWLCAGFVVMEAHRLLHRRDFEGCRATPTLKKPKQSRRLWPGVSLVP
jgi:hypothetical protein